MCNFFIQNKIAKNRKHFIIVKHEISTSFQENKHSQTKNIYHF